MTVTTSTGAGIAIGTTAAATDATTFAADTYVDIGEASNLGEFGDQANLINFSSLSDSRVRKLKGANDAGTMNLVVGRDPLDAGQAALKAAAATKFEYNFRVTAADAPDESHVPTVYYFRALVTGPRDNYGSNDQVVSSTYQLAINSAILEIITHTGP